MPASCFLEIASQSQQPSTPIKLNAIPRKVALDGPLSSRYPSISTLLSPPLLSSNQMLSVGGTFDQEVARRQYVSSQWCVTQTYLVGNAPFYRHTAKSEQIQ